MSINFHFRSASSFVKIWLNNRSEYIPRYLLISDEADDFKLGEPLPDTLNFLESGLT